MAKGNANDLSSSKYVALKIYSKRRIGNLFFALTAVAIISGLMWFNAVKLHHSNTLTVGVVGLVFGLLLSLLPLSEEWIYLPWQDAPRKLEQEIQD